MAEVIKVIPIMATRTQKKGPVYLHFDDGQVFVTPKDYDQFLIEARPAIEALRHACDAEVWVKNFFEDYIPVLHRWCLTRADKIKSCYVSLPVGRPLKVFVVTKNSYSQQIGEEIAKLELEMEDKNWSSDIMQIPATGDEDELQTFFKAEGSIQVYAETKAAPREGG
jgi:hypothetical protein